MSDQERIEWLEETLELIRDNADADLGGRVVVVHDEKAIGIGAFVKHALEVSREPALRPSVFAELNRVVGT